MKGAVCYLLLLLYCIVVQHNDVDSTQWMLIYGASAVSLFPIFLGYRSTSVYRLISLVAFCGAVYWSWMHWPLNEEEYREVGGFLVIAVGHQLVSTYLAMPTPNKE